MINSNTGSICRIFFLFGILVISDFEFLGLFPVFTDTFGSKQSFIYENYIIFDITCGHVLQLPIFNFYFK